jgi:glutathionylspermidine synthase
MMRESFGASLAGAGTQFVEPPWKAVLSNKGILPLLWAMFPRHPNLLPAAFEDDTEGCKAVGASFVRKPLYSREGANIELVIGGSVVDADAGPYGAEGFVRQAAAPLPQYDGNYAVIGSWVVQDKPCGLSVREDEHPITKNTSRFLPHAITG